MESSSPVLPLAVFDYQKLLQHSSSSLSSQQDVVPSRNSGVRCLGSRTEVLERPVSEPSDGIVDDSLKSEVAEEKQRERERNLLVAEVMSALGPCGSGLLAVTGVPEMSTLRKRLLPLAKKLALMDDTARRSVLKNYGLSTDVPLKRPDRPVSAFATKLQYTRHLQATDETCLSVPFSKSSPGCLCDVSNSKDLSRESQNLVSCHSDLEQLGSVVRQLGASMVEVGLLIARLCDAAISDAHLEDAIWESGSVKARLIHYHASTEKNLMTSFSKMGTGLKNKPTSEKLSKFKKDRDFEPPPEPFLQTVQAGNSCTAAAESANTISEDLWQGWHYDYGILTVLTAPMFLSSRSLGSTHGSPEYESCPGGHSGLGILSRGVYNSISVSPDCLIVQVGEAAQIASGGKLAAVAHCVRRPPIGHIDISRETFVTFLQPAWDRVLNPPVGVTRAEVLNLEGFPNSCTTSVEPKVKGEGFGEGKVELVYPRPLCTTHTGNCDGAVAAEIRNLELVDEYKDLPQSKEGKGCTKVPLAEMPNGQIQGIPSVELGKLASDSSKENLLCQNQKGSARANELSEQHIKVSSAIPSLDLRWKEGFTFAEFSRETTAQYYGSQGRQSQKTDHPYAS